MGRARDEQVERGIARLQGMLGPEEVLAPALQGGRSPRDRQLLSPWGERRADQRPQGLPWPGSIPPPAPARVFAAPVPAAVLDVDRRLVEVTDRGLITGAPAFVHTDTKSGRSRSRPGPDPGRSTSCGGTRSRARQVARFQIVGVDGSAWLMIVEDGQWWTEARYD